MFVSERPQEACPTLDAGGGQPRGEGDPRLWYARVVQLLPVAAGLHDRSGRVLAISPRMTELLGYTLEDIPTMDDWWRLVFPDPAFRDDVVSFWRERAHSVPLDGTGVVAGAECELRAKDGSSRWAEMRSFVDGELFVTLLLEMTKRHEAEDELRRQRRDYETIFNLVPTQIWLKDDRNRFVRVNRRVTEDVGLPAERIEGLAAEDVFPEYAAKYYEDDLEVLRGGRPKFGIIDTYRTASGDPRWVRVDKIPHRDQSGAVVGLLALAQDITEIRSAEEQLGMTQFVVARASEGIAWYELNGTLLYANETACRFMGRDAADAVGRTLWELIPRNSTPTGWASLVGSLQDGRTTVFEQAVETAGGERRLIEVSAHLLGYGDKAVVVNYTRDVTEQRRSEAALLESQKLEAVGTLAGGIAHDFNNLLMAILGCAEILALDLPENSPAADAARTIEQAASRAAELTNQLLGFARRGQFRRAPVDLHALLREAAQLLRRTIDRNIDLQLDLASPRHVVQGDAGQLQQVILNLALNARDAMPEGGALRIATRPSAGPEASVELVVADTGPGVSPDVAPRIFEPFFTTKGPGKGSGMGLAMVYGIAKAHGGEVFLERGAERGATFVVRLPLASAAEASVSADVAEAPAAADLPGRRVLLVDDEPLVRGTAAAMLERLGCVVTAVASGDAAVRTFSAAPDQFDVVLLDMVMPGLSAREVFHALRFTRAAVPVLLCSGFDRDGRAQEILNEGFAGFVKKPFTLETLSSALACALRAER